MNALSLASYLLCLSKVLGARASAGAELPNQSWIINNNKRNTDIAKLKSDGVEIIYLLEENEHSQFIAILKNGTVVNEGGIITGDGDILKDIQTSLSDQHKLMNRRRNINEENPMFFKGRLAVISSSGSENWYHWLLQTLPRLIILSYSDITYDRIYLNEMKHEWQRESLDIVLEFLEIPHEKLLTVNGNCIIQASSLIVPSVPFIPLKGTPLPEWLKSDLKSIFLNGSRTEVRSCNEKIYISRRNASTRRITNEIELISRLEEDGFKTLDLETLSPYEQAQVFSHAKVVVAPHGSGLANLIFASPGIKVVEIDHGISGDPRSFYRRMTVKMSGKYHPFYVDQTTEDHLDDDMDIDIDAFIHFLKKIMSSK